MVVIFLVAWTPHPGGYLFPVMLASELGSAGRQITFTVADVTSKVIYGILISRVAIVRSRRLGVGVDEAREAETREVKVAAVPSR